MKKKKIKNEKDEKCLFFAYNNNRFFAFFL
jgi:hypothetical protein